MVLSFYPVGQHFARVRRLGLSFFPAFFLLVALALQGKPVMAQTASVVPHTSAPRLALVIGNSRYRHGPLVNPGNDARAIAAQLRQAGFTVTLTLDSGRQAMTEAIRTFGEQLRTRQAIGVFYYAGHGLQLNWRNFLVPVDAHIRNPGEIAAQTVDVGLLLEQLERARNPMNVVILDACRNNPFGPDFRTTDRGLSQLDAPPGTLLAFATAPGNTAEDGEGNNGLYTGHLLKAMQLPGTRIEDIFKRVRLAVRRQSEGAQIPWESTSLEADFFLLPQPRPTPDEATQLQDFRQELALWLRIRESTMPEPLEAYLRQHPSGRFAELAQFHLDRILQQRGEKPVRPLAAAPLPTATASNSRDAAGQCLPPVTTPVDTAYRVGDRYDYRQLNLLENRETARFTDTVSAIDGENVLFNQNRKSTDLFGNINRAPDGRRWTPYQFFIADYQPGKTWTAQFVVTDSAGAETVIRFDLRVTGRERVTVPAGTFDTFRVEARGRNLSQGTTLLRTFWVAPQQVRGFVAQENQTRRGEQVVEAERIELTAFTQAAQTKTTAAGMAITVPAAMTAPAPNRTERPLFPDY